MRTGEVGGGGGGDKSYAQHPLEATKHAYGIWYVVTEENPVKMGNVYLPEFFPPKKKEFQHTLHLILDF